MNHNYPHKLLLMTLLIFLLLAGTTVLAQRQEKVTVCHLTGNGSYHTISIAAPALDAHLAHGDHLWFEGFCYTVEPGDVDFYTSEQACVDDFGGHLASIHSQAEDDFISALVAPGQTARIGAFAPQGFINGPDAIYDWTDGTLWDFQNWRSNTNEPNKTPIWALGSVQFHPNTAGWYAGWNDVPAYDPLEYYVCKH